MKERSSETVAARLRRAIKRFGPRPRGRAGADGSIRGFHGLLKARQKDGTAVCKLGGKGASYRMLHQYLKDDGPNPPHDFLREAAAILRPVRATWLATGDGEMTHSAQQREREVNLVEDRARKITAIVLDQLGRPPEPPFFIGDESVPAESIGPRPLPQAAAWSYPLLELWGRLWDIHATAAVDADKPPPEYDETAEGIGDALAAPLRVLGIGWDDMSDQQRNDYLLGTLVVLSGAIGPRP